MTTPFNPLNFRQWIDDNRHLLKPPVGNKCVWPGEDFIVMVVGGPNERDDFHLNHTPEFFYQLEGDATLRLRVNDAFQDVHIREGDIFLLPAGVPHSPQRKANTVGLVIEQKRPAGVKDGLLWFCRACGHKLYEEHFPLQNVEQDFPPVFERFWSDATKRTCTNCGTVMERRAAVV
jgi:3-hydroxyanthranilate 3,4-dioxygenase